MSERPMAQSHEWPETVAGVELLYRVCRSGPEVLFEVGKDGHWAQAQAVLKACRELLRVVAERDEARESHAFSQQQVRDLAAWNTKVRAQRDEARAEIAAAEARGAALAAERLADLESEQASLCDLLNTWAREEGVQQAERPGEMKSLADRLWGHLSRRVVAAEGRGAARAVEQCRRLAEEYCLELETSALAAATEHNDWRQDRLETASAHVSRFAKSLIAEILKGAREPEEPVLDLLGALKRVKPAPPSVVNALRAAVEAFPDEPDGGDEQ